MSKLNYTRQIPAGVIDQLCEMREQASSTWACTSTYRDLVQPYAVRDPLSLCVITEVIRQMDDHILMGGGQ